MWSIQRRSNPAALSAPDVVQLLDNPSPTPFPVLWRCPELCRVAIAQGCVASNLEVNGATLF